MLISSINLNFSKNLEYKMGVYCIQPCFKSILTDIQGHSELKVFYMSHYPRSIWTGRTPLLSPGSQLCQFLEPHFETPPLWAQLQLWKLFINFLNRLDFKVSQCHGLWNYTSPFYFFCSPRHSHFKITTCLFLVFINVRVCVGQTWLIFQIHRVE